METANLELLLPARLYWQCRRGMLELDIMLQGFLTEGFEKLDVVGKQVFLRILDIQDNELLEYLMGRLVHKEAHIQDVIELIRNTTGHNTASV